MLGISAIDEMMWQMNVNRKDMNGGLQDFIFGHLQKNSLKIKEDFNFIDKNFRRKIIGQRGDGVLEREGLLQDLKWSTTEMEFSRSILVWHLATEICYCVDKDANNVSSEYKTSRCLSEYCKDYGHHISPHWYDIVHFGPKPSWICSWAIPKRPHTNGDICPSLYTHDPPHF